jgi:hypothetical protein
VRRLSNNAPLKIVILPTEEDVCGLVVYCWGAFVTTGMPVPEEFGKVFGICGIDCAQRIRLRLILALRDGTGSELIGCHTRRSVAG